MICSKGFFDLGIAGHRRLRGDGNFEFVTLRLKLC
jgi:hypothetical protein